jgi:hypothetical protein
VELLLGPRIQNERSILFIPETFSIAFDADLTAGSFECALDESQVSGLRELRWGSEVWY